MPILKRKPKAPFSADYSKDKMARTAKAQFLYSVNFVNGVKQKKEFQGLIKQCTRYLQQKKLPVNSNNLAKMIFKHATLKQREQLNQYLMGQGELRNKIKLHTGNLEGSRKDIYTKKDVKQSRKSGNTNQAKEIESVIKGGKARQKLAAKKMKQRQKKLI